VADALQDGTCEELLFQGVVSRLTFGQAQPPAVIVDDDADVIRVVEGLCGAIERRIIEVSLRRDVLPEELVEIVPVFAVAELAALRGKIVLVPPIQFGCGRQRLSFASRLVIR